MIGNEKEVKPITSIMKKMDFLAKLNAWIDVLMPHFIVGHFRPQIVTLVWFMVKISFILRRCFIMRINLGKRLIRN